MGIQITFDYAAWAQQFPQFSSTVDEAQANIYFTIATTLHRNDGGGPVSTAATQTQLLNYVVAHLAFLYSGTNTQPAAQTVGRISSASEGSVSVQTDYGNNVSQSMAFWIQSQFGATYWAMTAAYRTMRYIPGVCGGGGSFGTGLLPWTYPNGIG